MGVFTWVFSSPKAVSHICRAGLVSIKFFSLFLKPQERVAGILSPWWEGKVLNERSYRAAVFLDGTVIMIPNYCQRIATCKIGVHGDFYLLPALYRSVELRFLLKSSFLAINEINCY